MEKLHFVDCSLLLSEDHSLLILQSRQRKVFNPWFSVGCVAFIASMFFKAMHNEQIAALPLMISTIILITGVWKLSGNGKIYFEKNEGKIFRFYKHLGYIQKLYSNPIRSIESVEVRLKENPTLGLRMDNNQLIILCQEKRISNEELKILAEKISAFLRIKMTMN